MSESRHKPKPAPYHTIARDCGCKLRVRLPGDGRIVPVPGGSAYCAAHAPGKGVWRDVVAPDLTARIDFPELWWKRDRETPVLPLALPVVVVAPVVCRAPRAAVAPRAPVMPLFMRGGA